jgi:hypothetical protein
MAAGLGSGWSARSSPDSGLVELTSPSFMCSTAAAPSDVSSRLKKRPLPSPNPHIVQMNSSLIGRSPVSACASWLLAPSAHSTERAEAKGLHWRQRSLSTRPWSTEERESWVGEDCRHWPKALAIIALAAPQILPARVAGLKHEGETLAWRHCRIIRENNAQATRTTGSGGHMVTVKPGQMQSRKRYKSFAACLLVQLNYSAMLRNYNHASTHSDEEKYTSLCS